MGPKYNQVSSIKYQVSSYQVAGVVVVVVAGQYFPFLILDNDFFRFAYCRKLYSYL